MSCEIKVRQCERCELTEGTVLCQECTGKEESDPVCYCATCSELVHKGRIAKHRLTLLEPGVAPVLVTKDEADSLIAKYKREVACLSKKIDEVEKAKDNINELMQKHDKAIRQTITVVVRQLQERGKYFIQQVAARSSEKKEQLTAIQTQLQDTQKVISQQIGSLEEIVKKSDTKDKGEMASVEAAMKDTEAAVQGKIEDTFISVKLPELDTEFDIDTSCVAEAVQALQINIHPEPSDEVIAERNDIEVLDLKISPDAELATMEAFVSGPLTRSGLFWAVPRFSKEMEAKLLRLSMLIRKMYIENATWKSFGDAGIQPTVGGDVYALYDADHKWYRGRVEDIKSSRRGSTVRFTDYGNTQNVSHVNMLPVCDLLAPRCAQQAIRCVLHETLEKLLPNEARWAFSDATGDTALNLTFHKQVVRDGCSAWLVDVKVQLKDGPLQDVNDIVMTKVIEDSQPKSTIMCKDIRYANVSPSSGAGAPVWAKGGDAPMPATGGSMSRRLASEDQMSNLAQISAILGSGGGLRRDNKMDEAETKRRQAKREKKLLKRARRPEAPFDPEAVGEQQVFDADKDVADEVEDRRVKLGITQSHVLPALGLGQIVPLEESVGGVRAVAASRSLGDGDHSCVSTPREEANEATDTTDSGVETQPCTTETVEKQTEGRPDMADSVDSATDSAKAVVESPADADVQPISSASPSLEDASASSHTDPAAASLDGDTTSLPLGDSACLPQDDIIPTPKDDVISSPKDDVDPSKEDVDPSPKDDVVLSPEHDVDPSPKNAVEPSPKDDVIIPSPKDDVVSSPKDDEVIPSKDDVAASPEDNSGSVPNNNSDALPQGGATGPVTSESPDTLPCSDTAATAVIELETDTVGEPPGCPGTVGNSDQPEPVMTAEVTGQVSSVAMVTKDDDVEMSQDTVDEPITETAVTPADVPCVDVTSDVLPSIPQTDGAADVCQLVISDDDMQEKDCDAYVDASLGADDVAGDCVKSYRVSPPFTTPPAIRALAQGDEALAVDTDVKQRQLADGDRNPLDSDVSEKRNNGHGDHDEKPGYASEVAAVSDCPQRTVVSSSSLPPHSSSKSSGRKPKSTPPPTIETALPKAKLYHGGEFQVRVTSELQTNGQFWVELVRDKLAESAYQEMLSQFKETANISASVNHVTPGILVLSPGEKDSWHRGRVSEVRGNKVDVCLIDCGRNISVNVQSLKELYKRFHRIPYQAVMCSIARKDYTQFGEKGQQLFKEKVRGRELLVKVITVGGTGSFVFVDLLDCSGPEPCNIYQLIYDTIPEERPVKQIPQPGAPLQTCVRNGEQGETVVSYPYVTVPASMQSGMPVSLMPYHPVPVLGDSGSAEPVRLMPEADPRSKSMGGYMPSMSFYTQSAVYPPSTKYSMQTQVLQSGGMPVDSSSCAGTMPAAAYVPHHNAGGTFCAKATMQGSGDATHNHVAYIPSSLPVGAHQDMHGSQPSSATGSEIECDDEAWAEDDRKTKHVDKPNWRQRPDHQDRHYHGGGRGPIWGRVKDDIICYGCQKRGHLSRDCPTNYNRQPNMMDAPGSWSSKGRDPKRGSRGGGGGGGGRSGPRGVDSSRGSASGHRSTGGRKHRNSRPSGGRQNYTGDEGGPVASSGSRMSGRKSSWQATESWED